MIRQLPITKMVLIVSALGTVVIACLEYSSRYRQSSLRAEYSVEYADIGIPGISKMYDARIVNGGALPRRIEVCDFIDDASARGHAAAFAVQKWDKDKNLWVAVMDASETTYCRPYPLGWASANIKKIWLWPGQSVSMGEEATAARGFRKGDSARFVLYPAFNERGRTRVPGIPTPSFEIDEEFSANGSAMRIRH